MGKLQSDKLFILPHPPLKSGKEPAPSPDSSTPPQIPPRMNKKKGPALPEKPPHIRAKSSSNALVLSASSQTPFREPLKPRILNLDRPPGTQREVLVAASKSGRERPIEKRQREPAKLLMPTTGGKKDLPAIPSIHHPPDDPKRESSPFGASRDSAQSKALQRLEEILPSRRDVSKNPLWSSDEKISSHDHQKSSSVLRKSRPLQPVLLIPRNLLTWGSSTTTPVSYAALWTSQRDVGGSGRGVFIKPVIRQPVRPSNNKETSGTSAVRLRSNSVTRSGSLTSQGSSSSDSGGETFPKSVLKKQRRQTASSNPSLNSKGSHSCSNRRVDQKKNVTFNAFATVQLMEE